MVVSGRESEDSIALSDGDGFGDDGERSRVSAGGLDSGEYANQKKRHPDAELRCDCRWVATMHVVGLYYEKTFSSLGSVVGVV